MSVNEKIGCPDVRRFRLDELVVPDYETRWISDNALAGLGKSIERFGCVQLIVVNVRDDRNEIVGGRQRYRVLQGMGVTEAICITVDLDPAEGRLLDVTLNNPHLQGQFIERIDAVIEELRGDLEDEQAMLDLRIDELLDDVAGPEKIGKSPDDNIPKPPKKSVAQAGDIWLLGNHRLMCGDSTNPDDVAWLMDGHTAVLMATDPPYCVDYTGADRPSKTGRDWSDTYREVEIKDAAAFIRAFLQVSLKVLQPRTPIYMWYADRRRAEIQGVCDELDILVHQQIIWVKPCTVITYSFYCWRHEPCLMMWQRGNKPPFRPEVKSISSVWVHGYQREGDPTTSQYYTDVWELDWEGHVRNPGIEHPTVKPVEVFAIPMRVHTKPGDICYEPFSGSGTQFIAAEKLGRRCFGMEKEPVFVDVAVKRWEEWTGKKAEKQEN